MYFNTVKTFTRTPDEYGRTSQTNCFGYAISTFGHKLEDIAKKPIAELISNVTGSIDETVKEYFTPVHDRPQDGDLVVYYSLHSNVATHAGIYREVQEFSTGVVESKWGWVLNPYVFHHSVFFTPEIYGDEVAFYHLPENYTTTDTECLGLDTLVDVS